MFRDLRKTLRPPENLPVDQWADRYRVLTSESSSRPGRWRTDTMPAARGPSRAVTDPEVRTLVAMCASQTLKSELILNTIGRYAHLDPGPMLLVQPTLPLVRDFGKDRVRPMFASSPALSSLLSDGSEILNYRFPGGYLALIGANAPGSMAGRPMKIVLWDETDRGARSAGVEGDPGGLLGARLFESVDGKFLMLSTPTIAPKLGADGRVIDPGSRIYQEFQCGDRRRFHIRCPSCGHRVPLAIASIDNLNGPGAASLVCAACARAITDAERIRLSIEAGHEPATVSTTGIISDSCGWLAETPYGGRIASYHVSRLASPSARVQDLADTWRASRDTPERRVTFINTISALPVTEEDVSTSTERESHILALMATAEDYQEGTIPAGGVILTAGVDVQAQRIELEIVAHGPGGESWSVAYLVLPGNTETLDGAPWQELARLVLSGQWPYAGTGAMVQISRMAIDSGYRTLQVYEFVRLAGASGRVIAVRGKGDSPALIASPKMVESRAGGKRLSRSVAVWDVGDKVSKRDMYDRLSVSMSPPPIGHRGPAGYYHRPRSYPREAYDQLYGEEQDPRTQQWSKIRAAVERADCQRYARAAAWSLGLQRWSEEEWAAVAEQTGATLLPPAPVANEQQHLV